MLFLSTKKDHTLVLNFESEGLGDVVFASDNNCGTPKPFYVEYLLIPCALPEGSDFIR